MGGDVELRLGVVVATGIPPGRRLGVARNLPVQNPTGLVLLLDLSDQLTWELVVASAAGITTVWYLLVAATPSA